MRLASSLEGVEDKWEVRKCDNVNKVFQRVQGGCRSGGDLFVFVCFGNVKIFLSLAE